MAHYEASQSQKILQCLQNGKFSDINIKVDGDIIPAHKACFSFIYWRYLLAYIYNNLLCLNPY